MAEEKEPPLLVIMEKVGAGRSPENFKLWVCRGEGRGCKRNRYRTTKKHCEDCYEPAETDTIEQVMQKMKRGNA